MTLTEAVYVIAGVALPAYYLPQILRCASDDTLLASYSMSKAATQWALRAAMLPFVFSIANVTMTWVVSLDFLGRTIEFGVAVWSLQAQGLGARTIVGRCLPVQWTRHPLGRFRRRRQGGDGTGLDATQCERAGTEAPHPPRRPWVLHPLVDASCWSTRQDALGAPSTGEEPVANSNRHMVEEPTPSGYEALLPTHPPDTADLTARS